MPDPGQLARILASLFAASRSDGRQRAHTLSHGLQFTVSTADGEFIALSRKDCEPDMTETGVVARDAGWTWFSADWQAIAGQRYIVIRPETPTGELEPEDTDPPSPETIALLPDLGAPWRHRSFTPQIREGGHAAVRAMTRAELREEWAWLNTKWKPQLLEYQRARLREALAGACPLTP